MSGFGLFTAVLFDSARSVMLKIWLEFSDVQVSVSNFCQILNFRGNYTTVSETFSNKIYIFRCRSYTNVTEINTLDQVTGKVIHDLSRTHVPLKALMVSLKRVKLRCQKVNQSSSTMTIHCARRSPQKIWSGLYWRRLASNGFIFKVSSRVKNHHLPNFQFLDD